MERTYIHEPAFSLRNEDQAWKSLGACYEPDPEKMAERVNVFFPLKGDSSKPAKKICASCPVTKRCLDYALGRPEDLGVWGGTNAFDRSKLRKGVRATDICVVCHRLFKPRRHGDATCQRPACKESGPTRSCAQAEYPPVDELISLLESEAIGTVAKKVGVHARSLVKHLNSHGVVVLGDIRLGTRRINRVK